MKVEPLYWNHYEEPTSNVSALLQQPAYKITADTLATAYMVDEKKRKRDDRRTAS